MKIADFQLYEPYLLDYLHGFSLRDRHAHFLALVQKGLLYVQQHGIDISCPPTDSDLGWQNPPYHSPLRIRFAMTKIRIPTRGPLRRNQAIVQYARMGLYAQQQEWRLISSGKANDPSPIKQSEIPQSATTVSEKPQKQSAKKQNQNRKTRSKATIKATTKDELMLF